jgi:hypothetical protein
MIVMRLTQLTVCVAVSLAAVGTLAESNSVARIDNAAQIDEIVQYYQAQCDEEQASVGPEPTSNWIRWCGNVTTGIAATSPNQVFCFRKTAQLTAIESVRESYVCEAKVRTR